ncbi:MAG: CotH kinase family protein [Pirellulaceae bacterium]|nr:CotH kinase family protein [Pirellulaceae bacterium]
MLPQIAWLVLISLISVATGLSCENPGDHLPLTADDDTTAYFANDQVPELRLQLNETSQQQLRDEPRKYAPATLIENDSVRFENVSVKLKGAAGSYRDFDDRPGFTLRAEKKQPGQTFHGMAKFHLNNAVQDETYLNEWIGWQLFQAAGYPAPQVAHVRLWINDRDMGLYVLREGFDERFLRRTVGGSDGVLFDGGFLQDIDDDLELDLGPKKKGRAKLQQLAIACSQTDPATRFRMLEEQLDIPRFLQFMALERLVGHWDGYSLNINNYRLYFPPDGKAFFLPHGMDQILGEPWAGLYDHSPALIAQCVMQNPDWRANYQSELQRLAPFLTKPEFWEPRFARMRDKLIPTLTEFDAELAATTNQRIDELIDRWRERTQNMDELISHGWPQALEIEPGQTLPLTEWYPHPETEETQLEEAELEGLRVYSIRGTGTGEVLGSWRHTLFLTRGRYRVEARVQTLAVVPIRSDLLRGAALYRQDEPAFQRFVGDQTWTKCVDEFEVREDLQPVELVLSLRAKYGQAWFDRESLQLIRLE